MFKKKSKSKDKFASPNTKKDADANEKEKFDSILMFEFYARKCFNGCRARKKKRNKQRG